MHVLLTYSAVKRRVLMGSRLPHERQPNFRHRKKKKTEKSSEANLELSHALPAGGVITQKLAANSV